MMKRHMLGLVVLGLLVSPGLAATIFTETFDGGTFGPNLVNQGSANKVVGGRVYSAITAYQNRNYVVTNDSDYATTSSDWTFTLDVDNRWTGAGNNIRIGIGSGMPSADYPTGYFFEPASAIFISLYRGSQYDTATSNVVSLVGALADGYPTSGPLQSGVALLGTARIKKVGGDLIFGWDEGSDGSFVEHTLAISAYSANLSQGSKLFCSVFEGNTTASVDNFAVTPEPTTMGLLGIGGLLTLIRRKRS